MNVIKANVRRRVEQEVDLVQKISKLELFGQPYNEVLLATDVGYKRYKAKEYCIIFKDSLLFSNYYEESGNNNYLPILTPEQLVHGVLRTLHGDFRKQPRATKTIIGYKGKCCFLKLAQLIRKWVMPSKQCSRESWIDYKFSRLPLQYHTENLTATEDAMQSDLAPGLPLSGGYQKFVITMDVFSRYLFASP